MTRGQAIINATGKDRDGRTKTVARAGDLGRINLWTRHQIGHRAFGILDLLQANDMRARTFAFAAAAHVKAKRDVAPALQQLGRTETGLAALVAAETMQHETRRTLLPRRKVVRDAEDAR